jgi:hypothetical protein
MRILFTIGTFLMFSMNLFGQFGTIAKIENQDEALELKTIFVYRETDNSNLEFLEQVLNENWEYNEIELISFEDFLNYKKKNNQLVFLINYSYKTISSTSSGAVSHVINFYLSLFQQKENDYSLISSSMIYGDFDAVRDIIKQEKSSAEMIQKLYQESNIYNWNYAYIGTIIKDLSSKLINPTPESEVTSNKNDKNKNVKLENKKIYVSDAVEIDLLVSFTAVNCKEKRENKDEDLRKIFGENFKVLNNEQINELVKKGEKGYLLVYQRNGQFKYINIIDIETNTIVYSFSDKGINLKVKDLKPIKEML